MKRVREDYTLAAADSIMRDLIRQFVAIAGLRRKVRGEQIAGLLDAVDDARAEIALLEMPGHFGGDLPPEDITAMLMHPGIANHGELPRGGGDVDEHAVAMMGAGHAKLLELALRGGHDIGGLKMADEDADLAGSLGLGRLDGGHDVVVPQLL